jgi:tetratricopeptide (TPR) repeat protein
VEAILEDVVERGTVNLKFVWDEAADIEKWSLSALAHLEKSDTRTVADYLRKQHVRFSETDLTSGLLRLREKDVLTPENRFVVHLLRLWLQKNRPIEQAREELTEVNPIANRYIEIGLEFKDSRLYEKAIESFQEALAVSKDNLQAQVNIALTYMDQKLYDKAIVEFEKALTMDDEDVSARAGLCEAHLALGDAAMRRSRMKDAVLSYQRVLAINAEHTEARGRMAEISSQRAEKALLNGRDEDALSAFTEALRFTPEDPKLIARVEQFRQEKKSKILAFLLAGAEKEAGAGNWDAAIKSLQEALPLSPSDASIPQKLEDARAAQAKEGALAAVYADAQKAYTEKNYDQAVGLFKKIILEDENYRDASRLLMQAIELRRTAPKWWLSFLWPEAPSYWNDLSGSAQPFVCEWGPVASALDPDIHAALDAIQYVEPLYQTSFDDWEFGDLPQNAALENGKLVLVSENQNVGAGFGVLPSDNFAVEFEFRISGSGPGNCYFGTDTGGDNDESFRSLGVGFDLNSQSHLENQVYPDQWPSFAEGAYDERELNKVTLMVHGGTITVFVNGILTFDVPNPDGNTSYSHHSFTAEGNNTCEFDNYKFWNLSEADSLNIQTALDAIPERSAHLRDWFR